MTNWLELDSLPLQNIKIFVSVLSRSALRQLQENPAHLIKQNPISFSELHTLIDCTVPCSSQLHLTVPAVHTKRNSDFSVVVYFSSV